MENERELVIISKNINNKIYKISPKTCFYMAWLVCPWEAQTVTQSTINVALTCPYR